ncbi:HAMP domain-containing sensor histidine kinase [Pedobacter sp. GR22-10]|uniref:HAMP domain-containing sensor histidine kinase n=1 Tax=Pedobacter sp. GR22-10 TaxID=2994472 RepID=UPI0022466BA4|nr:HAMP domain-containing sensor histidine kinase [Pedobacter sp. GR22-10]MCX2431003.1 HAMP domain-containing sensor histidine kinase [Pedobacter sp. GR22-10]
MKRYFYRGLRFRMTLLFSIVFIVINLVFSRFIFQYFKNGYVENYNKYLYTRAQTILDKTEINPDVIALPDSGESIRIFYHNNAHQPVLVFQSPGIISRLRVPGQAVLIDSLGQYGVYLKKENYDGRPVELLLTVSDYSLKHKINQFTLLMIALTGISLLASAVSAYFASGWLIRPIRSIAMQASEINTERLGQRIRITETHDELEQLAKTINEMIGRIEHEQQTRNNFFAAASHELRTPLANLRAQTELELGTRKLKTDLDLLGSQLSEISRLQSIVEQFLLISEFSQNGLLLRKSKTDISDQLFRVFARNNHQARMRNIQYDIRFSEDIKSFEISADAEKIEMVWQNLLQNALKYMSPGALLCSIAQDNQNLMVSFQNKTVQEKVNVSALGTPFTKGRTITSGSGLGLWLCKEIVEAHGGILKLESGDYIFKATVWLKLDLEV